MSEEEAVSEGAAQKFDVKRAKEIAWALDDEENVAEGARILMTACQRIEALEKLVGLAVEWLRQVDHGTNCHQEDAACLAFRKALEGSPE